MSEFSSLWDLGLNIQADLTFIRKCYYCPLKLSKATLLQNQGHTVTVNVPSIGLRKQSQGQANLQILVIDFFNSWILIIFTVKLFQTKWSNFTRPKQFSEWNISMVIKKCFSFFNLQDRILAPIYVVLWGLHTNLLNSLPHCRWY